MKVNIWLAQLLHTKIEEAKALRQFDVASRLAHQLCDRIKIIYQ